MSNSALSSNQHTGQFTWKSPSNLALVKYWGKFGRQYPRNASLSFTLDSAHTITSLRYSKKDNATDSVELDFLFEGKPKAQFEKKIVSFFTNIKDVFPFLTDYHFKIESENSFPHSSGIASSASAMSALALCLVSMAEKISESSFGELDFLKKASAVARLGSGSASRSVYPKLALWGKHDAIESSSNDYAIPYHERFDPVFRSFHDDILIVSKSEKSVSSTAGHALMEGNVFAKNRYEQANQRLGYLIKAMEAGNLDDFGQIVEDEALTLHALMMCSQPSYILIEPNTLNIIKTLRDYRQQTGVPVYFSLDAGPNIHLLYPDSHTQIVNQFVSEELESYCLRILRDKVGDGPKLIID